MNQEDLIQLLVDKSLAYLRSDDINPNVGMGLPYAMALDMAFKDVVTEASRWNTIEALRLQLTEEIKKSALDLIIKHRRQL